MRPKSAMAVPSSLLAGILLFAPHLTFAQTDNGDECNCFRTNGSSRGYFTYHRFQDFRNVAEATAPPAVITNTSAAANFYATSDFFTSDLWRNDWAIQTWNNSDTFTSSGASVLMVNSPNNVYIEKSTDSDPSYSSYLTLRTARLPGFQSTAEVDSNLKNYHYTSTRFLARVVGSPGACAGMFTYLASTPIQEADIEILTRDPRNRVQYTNQPSVDKNGDDVAQATVNSTIPNVRDWSVWNTYRVDWMPKQTSWYVNGISVANISYQVPKDPAGLILNMWSDGGIWTGNMSLYDEAYLQIQWIDSVYNTSGPAAGLDVKRDIHSAGGVLQKRKGGTPGCKVVCSIDEQVNVTGTPALLYNNTGTGTSILGGQGFSGLAWVPLIVGGAALFGWL